MSELQRIKKAIENTGYIPRLSAMVKKSLNYCCSHLWTILMQDIGMTNGIEDAALESGYQTPHLQFSLDPYRQPTAEKMLHSSRWYAYPVTNQFV